jgi:hypothetical protein
LKKAGFCHFSPTHSHFGGLLLLFSILGAGTRLQEVQMRANKKNFSEIILKIGVFGKKMAYFTVFVNSDCTV